MKFKSLYSLLLTFFITAAYAEIPNSYKPMIVEPPFSFSERIVDLTPALAESKRVKKPLLVYFGAADCPPCKVYTIFLKENANELQPLFSQYVVVDIRTWIKGSKFRFLVNDQKLSPKEFMAFIGDENKDFVFPSWWILDHQGKVIKQLPRGINNYNDIEKHKQLLSMAK